MKTVLTGKRVTVEVDEAAISRATMHVEARGDEETNVHVSSEAVSDYRPDELILDIDPGISVVAVMGENNGLAGIMITSPVSRKKIILNFKIPESYGYLLKVAAEPRMYSSFRSPVDLLRCEDDFKSESQQAPFDEKEKADDDLISGGGEVLYRTEKVRNHPGDIIRKPEDLV